MHSIDNLLHMLNSDGADELRLYVGKPPVLLLGDEEHAVDGPPLTAEESEKLLHGVADSRQRRELREKGVVEFIYRFRGCTDFVVRATMQDGIAAIEIH